MTTTLTCPRCTGPHMHDHPGGPLVFRHRLDCELLPTLDRTQAHESKYLSSPTTREATTAEIILATTLDPSLADQDTIMIRCERVTASIINRTITTI